MIILKIFNKPISSPIAQRMIFFLLKLLISQWLFFLRVGKSSKRCLISFLEKHLNFVWVFWEPLVNYTLAPNSSHFLIVCFFWSYFTKTRNFFDTLWYSLIFFDLFWYTVIFLKKNKNFCWYFLIRKKEIPSLVFYK